MAGHYGFSDNKSKVPANWAGHNLVPDHMRHDVNLGKTDPRPTFMRSGFLPEWFHMDSTGLGGVGQAPTNVIVIREPSFLDDIKAKIMRNPKTALISGILIGALIMKVMSNGRKR